MRSVAIQSVALNFVSLEILNENYKKPKANLEAAMRVEMPSEDARLPAVLRSQPPASPLH
jgi:hypothetical protein